MPREIVKHGFVKGRACLSNLLSFFEGVTDNLDGEKGWKLVIWISVWVLTWSTIDCCLERCKLSAWDVSFTSRLQNTYKIGRPTFVREKYSRPIAHHQRSPTVVGSFLFLLCTNGSVSVSLAHMYNCGHRNRTKLTMRISTVLAGAHKWSMSLNVVTGHLLT